MIKSRLNLDIEWHRVSGSGAIIEIKGCYFSPGESQQKCPSPGEKQGIFFFLMLLMSGSFFLHITFPELSFIFKM